jgi:hypothetical protein
MAIVVVVVTFAAIGAGNREITLCDHLMLLCQTRDLYGKQTVVDLHT